MASPKLAGIRQPGLHQAGAPVGGGVDGGGATTAALVTIADAGTFYSADNVEGALNEVGNSIGDLNGTMTGKAESVTLASRATGAGASLIGIKDAANLITALTVEAALGEIAYNLLNGVGGFVSSANLAGTTGGTGASLVGFNDGASVVPPIYGGTIQDALVYLASIKIAPLLLGGTGQTTAPAAFDALSVKAPDIASAATIDLSVASCPGNYVVITGAGGPVTSLGIAPAGTARVLRFASTPTITHNAASLILPGAANIVAAAGDVMFVHSLGSGNWRCTSYLRASSLPALAAELASTAAALGAALIGIQDAAGLITATTVEGALAELAGAPRLLPATLTDASVSVTTSTGSELTLPAATLTANRTITINAGTAAAGEVLRIIRRDATAFTLAIVNGGVGGGTMYTFPVSVARVADFQWDGTNWALAGHSRIS